MKWFFIIIITIFVGVIGYVEAAGPVKTTIFVCPVCKLIIPEGEDAAHRVIKGKLMPIHFSCAYERQIAGMRKLLSELKSKK